MWLHEELAPQELNGTRCAKRQTRPCDHCSLAGGPLDVAATFTSHATGKRGQHVVESVTAKGQMETRESPQQPRQRLSPHGKRHMSRRHSQSRSCILKMTADDDVSNLSAWTFVVP